MDFKKYVRDIPNFPQEGIYFKDITPLLQDANALARAGEELFQLIKNKEINKVVGMESRGFIFAPMLATRLNAGFVPVRKRGKLPHQIISESYELEYGTDVLEIHVDGILKGEKVLVHDDVLATGGTAQAVCRLIEKLGGEVVQCNFLMELNFLKGREKLSGYPVVSLISY